MSTTAGDAAERLLKRVRQHGGTATSTSFAIETLSRCQRIVNAGKRYQVVTTSLSVAKEKLVHSLRDDVNQRIIDVQFLDNSGEHVLRVDSIDDIASYDVDWWRKVDGMELFFWTQVGRDLLITYPGLATADTYTIVGTKLTDELSDVDDEFELADEHVDEVIQLAEVVLLMKGRQLFEVMKRLGVES